MKKIYLLCLLSIFSCYNFQKDVDNDTNNEKNIEIIIDSKGFNVKEEDTSMFTTEEIEKFKKNNIDIREVKKYINLSKEGNPKAINLLSYVYHITADKVKLKEILEIGVRNNVKEAIYNLALVELDARNYNKALTYFDKLPKDYKQNEIKNLKIEIYIELATQNLNKKNYDEVIKNLIKAYNLDFKELDYEIYKLYKDKNDKDNEIKWLKLSSSRGNKDAILELAQFYYDQGDYNKSIEIYQKLYNNGEVKFAKNIFEGYLKLSDNNEIVKWYDISRDLNLIDEVIEVEKLKLFNE